MEIRRAALFPGRMTVSSDEFQSSRRHHQLSHPIRSAHWVIPPPANALPSHLPMRDPLGTLGDYFVNEFGLEFWREDWPCVRLIWGAVSRELDIAHLPIFRVLGGVRTAKAETTEYVSGRTLRGLPFGTNCTLNNHEERDPRICSTRVRRPDRLRRGYDTFEWMGG